MRSKINTHIPNALLLLVLIGFIPLYAFGSSELVKAFLNEFAIYVMAVFFEALGFVLLGCFTGSLIEEFVNNDYLLKITRKHPVLSYVFAGASGFIFPVCECAIVPVTRRLIKKGLPPSVAITFLLAVPIFNPIVGLSTWLAFGGRIDAALVRLVSGLCIAVLIGFASRFILGDGNIVKAEDHHEPQDHEGYGCGHKHCTHDHHSGRKKPMWQKLASHTWSEFSDLAPYFIFGICAAAFTRTLINMNSMGALVDSPASGTAFMMIGAFALNLCSEADAFVAAGFRTLLSGSAVYSFLVYGPMMDLKLLAMYQSVFKKKTSLFLLISVTLAVFTLSLTLGRFGLLGGFSL